MSIPFGYVPAEQQMRDKADYARKGIARGRSSVVLQYKNGILLVAHNASRALHKISEIYDRIGFAAVGRYNEFEALRLAGIRYADVNGYNYDRADVTGRGLANFYAQQLGMIFTDSIKPFEVEIVVAEVGNTPEEDQIYRLTFDGSVQDEHGGIAMGGQADAVAARLKEQAERLREQAERLADAQRRQERAALSSQEGHWEGDLITGKHWVSSSYYKLLGYEPDELDLGTLDAVEQLFHPDDRDEARSIWERRIAEGEPYSHEARLRMRDGSYRWFRIRGMVERGPDGTPVRTAGSIQDIHRQKLAEDALRETQARFERAIRGTQDGLWEVDVRASRVWLSPRVHQLHRPPPPPNRSAMLTSTEIHC